MLTSMLTSKPRLVGLFLNVNKWNNVVSVLLCLASFMRMMFLRMINAVACIDGLYSSLHCIQICHRFFFLSVLLLVDIEIVSSVQLM